MRKGFSVDRPLATIAMPVACLLALAGCGGGSGGGDSAAAAPATPQPTVTLSATPATVAPGGTAQLQWSASNATACTASGGWSGSQPTSGTFASPRLAATTAYTLQCSGPGGSGSATATITVDVPAGQVVVSGRITFARVPHHAVLGEGLDYVSERQDPAREIAVEIERIAGLVVIATTRTDDDGRYYVAVPANTPIRVAAVARMLRATPEPAPHWNFTVRDVELSSLPYRYVGSQFDPSTSQLEADLEVPSGWNAVMRSDTGPRAAAPFAILDTIRRARDAVLAVSPVLDFPALVIDWSTSNPGGETFYVNLPQPQIVLSGERDVDTDEYDEHVIAHEFGHYIEDRFGRADSIGGAHGPGDHLDPRVAFGEGFGYAFAAIVLEDPQMRDTCCAGQADEGHFNVESNAVAPVGWYSEPAVWAMLWDIHDPVGEASDQLALGWRPIWDVLINDMPATDALTTIFPFMTALKRRNPAAGAGIDALLAQHGIRAAGLDDWGSAEVNDGGSANVLPLYTPITLDGPPVTVTSIGSYGTYNKLSNSRFLRLDMPQAQTVRIRVTAPAGRDADVAVLRRGAALAIGQVVGDEDISVPLQAGTVVLEVYDCANAACANGDIGPVPLTVSVTTN